MDSDDRNAEPGSGSKPRAAPERDQRRAAALRANLQRRKAQVRGRSEAESAQRNDGRDKPK